MFVVSPTAILYDQAGNPVAVSPNVAIPAGTSTILVAGTDGTDARILSVDSNGKLAIQNPSNLDTALSTRLSTSAFTARVNVLGQNTMSGSTPVVLASDQSAIPVTDNGGSLTIDGTVNANLNSGTNYVGRVRQTDGTLDLSLINTAPPTDTGQVAIPVRIISSLATGGGTGTVTANQGTATGTAANAWPVKTSDGTNYITIKAASTAALATDTSQVVALSPNTPLPTGTNAIGSVTATQATAANLNATAAQGSAAALAGAWPSKITDGTNGPVAVKAASTSALTTDPSLVVQISPNQEPIPTTVVPATSIAGSAIGRASSLTANTFVAVRQTTYVEQTTNAQRSIVSTSANDSAAGTGARQVRITYLTATGTGPFTETVTLNGLTAVNTVATDICFIERMDVISVGSNSSNVGTINLYTTTGGGGTIFAAIGTGAIATGVGDNQTLYAHHYVPVNYSVKGYYVSVGIIAAAGGGSSVTVIRYRNPTVSTSPWLLSSDIVNAAQGNSAARTYYASVELPGPAVILAWTTPANNNSTATCSFDYADAPV